MPNEPPWCTFFLAITVIPTCSATELCGLWLEGTDRLFHLLQLVLGAKLRRLSGTTAIADRCVWGTFSWLWPSSGPAQAQYGCSIFIFCLTDSGLTLWFRRMEITQLMIRSYSYGHLVPHGQVFRGSQDLVTTRSYFTERCIILSNVCGVNLLQNMRVCIVILSLGLAISFMLHIFPPDTWSLQCYPIHGPEHYS